MDLVQSEDSRDLELQLELEESYESYLLAGEGERAEARAAYIAKLRAFTARVLQRYPAVRAQGS